MARTGFVGNVGGLLRNLGPFLGGSLYESYYFGVIGPGLLNQVPTLYSAVNVWSYLYIQQEYQSCGFLGLLCETLTPFKPQKAQANPSECPRPSDSKKNLNPKPYTETLSPKCAQPCETNITRNTLILKALHVSSRSLLFVIVIALGIVIVSVMVPVIAIAMVLEIVL